MPKLDLQESETVEFKRQWTDKALEDLAAFANTKGGTLFIGVRKDGEVVGAPTDDREIQRITNLITSNLGITPSIRVVEVEGKKLLEIRVKPAQGLIVYGGRYLRRVGSTNRDFPPAELARHILERSGRTWDGLSSEWTLDEISPEAIAYFSCLARNRLPHIDPSNPVQTLQNLDLLEGERLKNAAVLLFGKSLRGYSLKLRCA